MNVSAQEQERALFEAERARAPHLFEREPMVDTKEFLAHIGINVSAGELPVGYLRLFPQDFIVEEVSQDGTVHTVDDDSQGPDFSQEGKTLYADLVKITTSGFDAQSQLAELLGVRPQDIGYAGIKDRMAITGQTISIRNLHDEEKLHSLAADNFFLKHIKSGKGAVANGELKGNRFIITVRLAEPLTREYAARIEARAQDMKEQGFWNFFSFQRFGTPRLLSHRLGLHIIKGEFEEAVRLFLLEQTFRELPYFKDIRARAGELWGKWDEMIKLFEPFPSHFPIELQFVSYLRQHSTDFLGALNSEPDQVRLWIYAYDSYLFNRKLSEYITTSEVPVQLPLATSFNERDWEPYREFLKEDGVDVPSRHYKKFPSVRVASRTWPTLQEVEIHSVALERQLAVFAFTLPKGAYATTFLMNFFSLAAGLPVVPGISQEKLDAKEKLGLGSLQGTLKRFEKVLEAREQDIVKTTEL